MRAGSNGRRGTDDRGGCRPTPAERTSGRRDRYRCDRQRSPRGYHDRRGPPGRVCRATRARVLPPPTAGRSRGNDLRDGQHDLLRDAPIASLLPDAHQRGELVVERIDVLDARVDDLEAEIRERVALGEPLEDHFADPPGRDLGCAALPDARLEVVDEPIDLLAGESL